MLTNIIICHMFSEIMKNGVLQEGIDSEAWTNIELSAKTNEASAMTYMLTFSSDISITVLSEFSRLASLTVNMEPSVTSAFSGKTHAYDSCYCRNSSYGFVIYEEITCIGMGHAL